MRVDAVIAASKMTLFDLSTAAGDGDIAVVRRLLREHPPPLFIELAFCSASSKGRLKVMSRLRREGISMQGKSNALCQAAEENQRDAVQMLLRMRTFKHVRSDALELAVAKGHVEVVRELIPYSDPWAPSCRALVWAARLEHTAVMQVFVDAFDERAIEYWERDLADTDGVSAAVRKFCEAWRARQAAAKTLAEALGHNAGPTAG